MRAARASVKNPNMRSRGRWREDRAGRVDETVRRFSSPERRIAEMLAQEGRTVTALPEGSTRAADAAVDGVAHEFKTLLPGATSARVPNCLNRAKGQASRVVIDARGSGLTRDEAVRGVARAVGAYPDRFRLVRIICDDYDLTWSEEGR